MQKQISNNRQHRKENQLAGNHPEELKLGYHLKAVRKTADSFIGFRSGQVGYKQSKSRIQETAAQRNHHGLHITVGYEETGKRAAERSRHNSQKRRHPDIHAAVLPRHANDYGSEAHNGSCLNINTARYHDKSHKQRNNADCYKVVYTGK